MADKIEPYNPGKPKDDYYEDRVKQYYGPGYTNRSKKPEEKETGSQKPVDTTNQYYQDPMSILKAYQGDPSVRDTSEYSLYQLALQQKQSQLQGQQQQLDNAETGMQMDLSENRQQLLDEIRNRRRTLLKNGLSSSQVANQEIQSLLQRQEQASQIARQYYDQQQQIGSQMEAAPQNAAMEAYQMAASMNQSGSAFAAADSSNIDALARKYMEETGERDYAKAIKAVSMQG